jgi:hypothetical protein
MYSKYFAVKPVNTVPPSYTFVFGKYRINEQRFPTLGLYFLIVQFFFPNRENRVFLSV